RGPSEASVPGERVGGPMAVFGPPGPAISRSAIVHDPFDEEAFQEILPRATGLRLLLNESDRPMRNELAFDLFCSFYKYFVKLRSPAEVAPEAQGNRDLLGRALDLREHAKLRGFTKLKPTETALATELVLDALLREMARGPPAPEVPAQPQEPTDMASKAVTWPGLLPASSRASPWRNGRTCSTRRS